MTRSSAGGIPQDEHNGPYQGGWPLQHPDVKDAIEADSPASTELTEGARLPRFRLRDPFDAEVDLYDLAGHGVPIVVFVVQETCCGHIGDWLNRVPFPLLDPYTDVTQAVDDGRVIWVTMFSRDDVIYPDAPRARDDAHGHPLSPVLGDDDHTFDAFVWSDGRWMYPFMVLVNPADMTAMSGPGASYLDVLDMVQASL